MQKILVAVSPEEIIAARQWYDITYRLPNTIERPYVCPIALSLSALVKEKVEVSGHGYFKIGTYRADLPFDAKVFVEKFDDDREEATPFSFELELPDEVGLR